VVVGDLLRLLESAAALSKVFAPRRYRELIQRIVRVIRGRLDPLVSEVDDVLRVRGVSDSRDIASRIVRVGQILHYALVCPERGGPRGRQLREVKRLRIVSEDGDRSIAERE